MNTNFINIIQMISQNFRFRLVLILILLQITLSLNHIGNCFGNCFTCETNNPSICKGDQPCEWGYYYNESNGNCQLLPSLKLANKQLLQPSDNSNKLPIRNWGSQAKYSTCESSIQGKKQTIDIIGIFFQIQSISRILKITPGLDIYQLSFNLIRDQWMPFNDFLIIDIFSQQSLIQSIEISYQSRIKIDSQPMSITCEGKKFINEKYNIKIVNKGNILGEDISLYFTSVLYNSRWGIANIKLLEGCNNYVKYNQKKQDCSLCENGMYPVYVGSYVKSCEKCSLFCDKCESKDTCLGCMKGAQLSNGKCVLPGQYKLQWIDTKSQQINCNTRSFMLGNLQKKVSVPLVNNHQDELYDEVQIGFQIYYNPIHWGQGSQNAIKVKINQIEVFTLNNRDLNSNSSDQCIYFKGNRVASISYLSKPLIHMSSKLNLQFQLSSADNITFGVQNIFVKSIVKPQKAAPIINLSQKDIISKQIQKTPEPTPLPTSQSQITKQETTISTNPTPKTPIIIASSPSLASEQIITPKPQTPKHSSAEDQKLSLNTEQFSQIEYLPIVSSGQPGIQLSIQNIKQVSGNLYVLIDKLPKQSVKIIQSYIQDEVLHVFVSVNQSFTEGVLSVIDNITTSTSRLLQKNEMRILARTFISRFDYISTSQADSISNFSTFYSVFAWFGVILIIPMVMLGFGVTVEEYIFTLQFLFLHLYICTDILPLSFRDVIAGLRIVQNLNFFVPAHGKSIESEWIGNVVQNGPVRTSLYNTDINFTREIYPIIIVNIIFIGWFLIVFIAKKTVLRVYKTEKTTWNIIINNIADRVINYADQIWRYQFMSVVWLCFIQFQNFIYPSGSNRSETLNIVLCISCFICSILWPLITGFISRKQYYQNQYSDFIYKYQDIYYHRIPLFYLPTRHHRVGYPLLKIAKLFLIPFIIAYVGDNSITLVLLIIIQVLQVIYAKNYDIYQDSKYFKLRLVQNSLFCLLQIIILSLQTIKTTSSTVTFSFFGFLLSSIGILIITTSILRILLLSYKKYTQLTGIQFQQMCQQDLKKLKTQRVV